jgi:hypothetical protein
MDTNHCHIVVNPAAGGAWTGHMLDTLSGLLRSGFGDNCTLFQLFGFDPTSNLSVALRNSITVHLDFTQHTAAWGFTLSTSFAPKTAMLIGPSCLSAGDPNAYRMPFHPTVRSFGEAANGAVVAGNYEGTSFSDAWTYRFPTSIVYSNFAEDYLIHKGVQPDEEVWLTRDGVAKGEDDVVKRALAWIDATGIAKGAGKCLRASY